MTSKTKEDLIKELSELEELEKKVQSKKSGIDYKNLEVPFKVGENYFIRTVTYFALGKVKAVVGQFVILGEASWVADTGRFSDFIAKGIVNEVEPIDVDMFVNINSITDAFPWVNKLLRERK